MDCVTLLAMFDVTESKGGYIMIVGFQGPQGPPPILINHRALWELVKTMMTPTKSLFAVLAIVFFSVAVTSFFIGPGYVDSHTINYPPDLGPDDTPIPDVNVIPIKDEITEYDEYNGVGSNIWHTNGDAKDAFFWLAGISFILAVIMVALARLLPDF